MAKQQQQQHNTRPDFRLNVPLNSNNNNLYLHDHSYMFPPQNPTNYNFQNPNFFTPQNNPSNFSAITNPIHHPRPHSFPPQPTNSHHHPQPEKSPPARSAAKVKAAAQVQGNAVDVAVVDSGVKAAAQVQVNAADVAAETVKATAAETVKRAAAAETVKAAAAAADFVFTAAAAAAPKGGVQVAAQVQVNAAEVPARGKVKAAAADAELGVKAAAQVEGNAAVVAVEGGVNAGAETVKKAAAADANESEILARIEAAVESVQSDMVASGENVLVWKLSRLVLAKLQADSWNSLGFRLRDVPSLDRLIVAEGKNVKGSIGTFIATWKEACIAYKGVELFVNLLDFYALKKGITTELISCFSTSPLLGLLNVSVIAIKNGTWDSLSNTFLFNDLPVENVDDSIRTFVRTWKEAFKEFTAPEAFGKLLLGMQTTETNRLRHIFSTFPLVGFLNVAVASMKKGMWDSLCDTAQSRTELGKVVMRPDELMDYTSQDGEPIDKIHCLSSDGLSCHPDVHFALAGPPAHHSEKVMSNQLAERNFNEQEAACVIESIRREEFGLGSNMSNVESSMLKKQHARLARALYCLSQELYSQNAHFLLELVQNADDNLYPVNVEPTLSFVLQSTGIAVLNNESGFTAENMRSLCDVGNSTKKGSLAGHIGQKGIGFKSVFRVTDAPEVHSNGFHVKFDTSEGLVGAVLPTTVPPCDFEMIQMLASGGDVQKGMSGWNTCIVLPFKRKYLEGSSLRSISSMFSDLHPSLLLFLRRLKCIKLRNMLHDSHIVMKKEIVGDGIVRLTRGKEKMSWFVTSSKLHPKMNSSSVHMTEISAAFMLKETVNGDFDPLLHQQPVFAFLPLRKYGLKFILQADFVLPSSGEEVDEDSSWNQWLLSEFPDFFVNAEKALCSLPCFQENPAKAVSVYMSFVPLTGEVQGFFSGLPQMIISKLRQSNCLLQDGCKEKWVPPCKVLKGCNSQARTLLPGNLLCEHLGLGFLHKDINLSDTLATALGIQVYGPKTLVQFISSLGHITDGIKSMGLDWLFSWLNELHSQLYACEPNSKKLGLELDLINSLKKVPFIPLSDGTYSSLDEGTIWLHDHVSTQGHEELASKAFPHLYASLRTVSPALFSESSDLALILNCMRMLQNVGVRLISAHELIRIHILPSISDERLDRHIMVEYMTFVMLHTQSTCISCLAETEDFISELCSKAVILTNYGYKRPSEIPIHFSREFGNSVDVRKFLRGLDFKWHEIDTLYMKNPIAQSLSCGLTQWREFFQKLGVTDFVKVVPCEKSIAVFSPTLLDQIGCYRNLISPELFVKDWESPELVHLLYLLSKDGSQEKCKYFVEVLDALWDDHYSEKAVGFCSTSVDTKKNSFQSSLLACLSDVKWVVSSLDSELHFPKELFHDCDAVRSILGCHAPYAVPKIKNLRLLTAIGFKTQVTLSDALEILQTWRSLKSPFTASLSQMCKLYSFIWKEMVTSRQEVVDAFKSGPFIFVPTASFKNQEDVVAGDFLSPKEVYWHDSTGVVNHIRDLEVSDLQNSILPKKAKAQRSVKNSNNTFSKTLRSLYPSLHNFFVTECCVNEAPSFHHYLQILLQLSKFPISQEAARMVFRVLVCWAYDLACGTLCAGEMTYLKEHISELDFTVLPTMQDKWISLHPSFGLVCWCDDDILRGEFEHSDSINFLYFGKLTDNGIEVLRTKVSVLLKNLGIPSLSEIVSREAICNGQIDSGVTIAMIKRVLPFAQRYLYNLHPESYSQHKLSISHKLHHLQIVVVEKLLYRNVIEKRDCASKNQYECNSLLQGDMLYASKDADPHSVFLELSRLLFDGTPNLHLANFLHMMTLIEGSGKTEEQIELFILNSQKMAKLPNEESVWSLPSPLALTKNGDVLPESASIPKINEHVSNKSKKNSTNSSSPPRAVWMPKTDAITETTMKNQNGTLMTTDGVSESVVPEKADAALTNANYVAQDHVKKKFSLPGFWKRKTPPVITNQNDSFEITDDVSLSVVPKKADMALTNVCDVDVEDDVIIQPCPTSSSLLDNHNDLIDGLPQSSIGALDDLPDIALETLCLEDDPSEISEKNQVITSTPPNSQQAMLTGRQGELMAYQYFTDRADGATVNWVNQDKETGLPYDIVLGEEENKEYIEVKATRNAKKNWFQLSKQEWQFATEKGDFFSLAHVILSGEVLGRLTVYKNPVKLYQTGELRVIPMTSKSYCLRPHVVNPI